MVAISVEAKLVAHSLGGIAKIAADNPVRSGMQTPAVTSVLSALKEFDACKRYLKTRRSEGAILNIESEADVQDLLYLLLRPWVVDLVYESPADKSANRFVIKDFSSATGRFVIDAKYIRNKDHGRLISKELHDDIEMYRRHPRCDSLIFFVYDPEAFIPDERALREAVEIDRTYGGERHLSCHLVVKG